MPKRSQRHPSHYEKNHGGGCISGLMNMFEFRHSRLNRKLLSGTEPANRQNIDFKVMGSSSERSTLQNYTKKKEKNPKNLEDTETTDFVKTSVKKLMEDDMINEQLPHKPIHVSKGSLEQFNSNRRNDRRDSRRSGRASRSSIDMDLCDEDGLKSVEPKYLSHQVNKDKTSEAPNLHTLIEELSKIHSRSRDCTSDYLGTDTHMHLDQDVVVIPDELSAAIKVIISERHLEEDDKTSHSREFMDALEILNSNKQALLELLQDSNSQFLKQMEASERASLKNDQKSNSLRGTTISNTPTVLEPRKPRKFFRRRSKSLDSYPLGGEETSHSSTKIVILKPGLAGSRFQDNESRKGASSNLHSIQDKGQGDRHSSYFFFTEIKRKLQHAMGKEHHGVPSFRSSEHRIRGDTDKGAGGDNLGWRSPNRNHFYTEIFSKPSPSLRRDNIVKSKGAELDTSNNTSGYPNQGVSNIYIEAKKHLSEMLNTKEDNPDSVQRQSPKSLGGILSLPTYKDLSSWSHEKDLEDNFITAHTRLTRIGPSQGVNHSPQNDQNEGDDYMTSSEKSIDNQINMSGENIHEKGHSCDPNCRVSCELKNINTMEETTVSTEDVIVSKNSLETNDNTQTPIQENDEILNEIDISVNRYPDKENVENDNDAICKELLSSKCSDSDSIEDGQQSPSLIEIPLSPTVNTKVEDTENVADKKDRQSPISVLEPLFSDYDISPPRVKKDYQVKGEIRPQKIHFGEEMCSVGGVKISSISVVEDGESPFDYVEAVLLGSDLNWDDFLLRWLSSDQILDPSVFQEVELFSSRHNDQKLLFDCTNEVLKEVCDRYFGCFVGASFKRQIIRPVPRGMNLINEIWDGVEWYLFQHLPSKSLDQLVESDMKKSSIWMDLRRDTERIGTEIESAILEKLLEDTVGCFVDNNSEAEPHETEISIDS